MAKPKKTKAKPKSKLKTKTVKKNRREPIQSVKGMRDVMSPEIEIWEHCQEVFKKELHPFGFSRIETPVLEKTELFIKGTGEDTDIVQKEMFTFNTKGGESVTLRPEGTPGVMRAYTERGLRSLAQPVKLYYIGPMFRHEKPQAGRYRQHYQLGLEVVGNSQPILDAEVIYICAKTLNKLGLDNIEIQINSLGCPECRKEYKETLVNFYSGKRRHLCDDCKKRLRKNPFRVLDCKKEKCQEISADVPPIVDFLCEECNDHFKRVLEYLDEVEVVYNLNSTLVRGLDYYTRTVFEIWAGGDKEAARCALGGGGRYDGLARTLGGRQTSGLGAAMGLDRIASQLQDQEIKVKQSKKPDVLLIQLGELAKKKSLKIFGELIKSGIVAREAFHKDSIKSQLRLADKLDARFALILGQKEATNETILIRNMKDGIQEIISLDKLVDEIKKRLKKKT